MADRITLEVATPSRLVIAEQVEEVVVPGIEGYFGVLPGHAPLLSTLGIGELMYRIGRDEHHAAVSGGFCEVRKDKGSGRGCPPGAALAAHRPRQVLANCPLHPWYVPCDVGRPCFPC